MTITIVWDVTPYSLVQRLRRYYYILSLLFDYEDGGQLSPSEILLNIYQTTWRHISRNVLFTEIYICTGWSCPSSYNGEHGDQVEDFIWPKVLSSFLAAHVATKYN
jgi:hypothetical protein